MALNAEKKPTIDDQKIDTWYQLYLTLKYTLCIHALCEVYVLLLRLPLNRRNWMSTRLWNFMVIVLSLQSPKTRFLLFWWTIFWTARKRSINRILLIIWSCKFKLILITTGNDEVWCWLVRFTLAKFVYIILFVNSAVWFRSRLFIQFLPSEPISTN